jgi:predicted small metal-binding protein
MRAVNCPCGLTLTGADNDELIRRGRNHADEHHAGDGISDDFIREHVAANARDAAVA